MFKRLSRAISKADVEQDTRRVAPPEFKISIVRVKPQPRKHNVIKYGYKVTLNGEVPDVYKFEYQADLDTPDVLYPGVVPADFSAGVPVSDTRVFFHTREGATGPEYRVAYSDPDNILLDWSDDVDHLWVETMQALEESGDLSEDDLNFLDVDPLFLFGVADPTTQKAIEKAATVPMLRCMDQRPILEEWFAYLNADPAGGDAEYKWVIESFAECELPVPWASFKDVGSIVCYLNNETQETTWKHPYYDYFSQLLNHCRRATREEHIKLRLNRMLWSYEADSQSDLQNQMPLISPKFVKIMAEILKVDIIEEPFTVRTLKTFLKAFSQQYRLEEELDTQEITWCLEIVENERAKTNVARGLPFEQDPIRFFDASVSAQLHCVQCGVVAENYCPQCGDCFCLRCFEKLHRLNESSDKPRSNRSQHKPNHIIPCVMCKKMPAKLQCIFSFGTYCPKCFAEHAKTLPKYLDLRPLKIDYLTPAKGAVGGGGASPKDDRILAIGEPDHDAEELDGFSKTAPLETVLGERWHAFYDLRGVKYYYNFETEESMRRPDERYLDPVAVAASHVATAEHSNLLKQVATAKGPRMLRTFGDRDNLAMTKSGSNFAKTM